ncbi:MAG: hypothetical protein K8R67_12990 [Desulfobacteraceae bacterium]|nr:hypothetical protein [Desulfobacteraceae bacterium]
MDFTRDKLYTLASVIFVLILTFSVYSQLSNHEFLILDDHVYVTANQYVQSGLKLENIYWAFTSFEAEFWHPVTWLSYMLDTQIYSVMPGGYLLTNLIIHLLNTLLVFFLFTLMTKRTWESFLISALFALHPLHVETVAWISERKELLCGFFWLTATVSYYYYTESPDWKRYFLIVAFFLLGIMSKTMIVTLPFTFLLLDFWPLKRDSSWINLVTEKIPLFLISIAGIVVTLFAQDQGGGLVSLERYSICQRIINSVVSYAVYIKKTIWPENLSVFYPVKDFDFLVISLSALLLIILTLVFIYFSKRQKFLITGWLWFLGTLVPVIGIVKIGDFSMADRYTYIPIIGLFIIFSFGINAFVSRSAYKSIWLILIPVIILGCYVPNTFYQIKTWKNTETLLTHSLKVIDNNFLAHHALGELFAGQGDMKQAVVHFSKAVEVKPDNAALWAKLGRALYSANFKPKAIISFEKAQTLEPKHPAPHFYLLCSFLDQNKTNKAQEQLLLIFEKNIKLVKDNDYQLFKSYVESKEFKKAEMIFKKILKKIGIINSKHIFRSLIIKGHKDWETTYLKQVNHEN